MVERWADLAIPRCGNVRCGDTMQFFVLLVSLKVCGSFDTKVLLLEGIKSIAEMAQFLPLVDQSD
jgi:hypothetical protein